MMMMMIIIIIIIKVTDGQQFPCKNRILDTWWWLFRPKNVVIYILNNFSWF
jgi:hypothetical protein